MVGVGVVEGRSVRVASRSRGPRGGSVRGTVRVGAGRGRRSHRGTGSVGGRVGTVLLVQEAGRSTVRVLARGETETGVVELGDGHDVDEAVDGLGEEIEDTVEDHLRGGGDDVSSIGDTPGDRVEEPEGREDDGRGHVGLVEVRAEASGRGATGTEEDDPDTDEGGATEGEESPLVDGGNESTDETSDDLSNEKRYQRQSSVVIESSRKAYHDDVEEDEDEDLRERKSGSEGELEKEERSGDGPINVSVRGYTVDQSSA